MSRLLFLLNDDITLVKGASSHVVEFEHVGCFEGAKHAHFASIKISRRLLTVEVGGKRTGCATT